MSLVPSLSEALVSLGLRDRLVGVTEYCVHPRGAFSGMPRLGGTKDADVDAIAALAPDLVIANQEENTERVVRALAEQGIDVWVTYPRTVREGLELLEDLSRLDAGPTNRRTARARAVIDPVRSAVAWAESQKRARKESGVAPTRVFCPIWRDPWMGVGAATYIHDLIELCGGENLTAEASERRYPILTLDEMVALAPDLVLLPDEPYAFGPADRAELLGLGIPAARSGQIHLIDGTLVSWYGPRIAEAIRVLAALFAIP